MIDRYLEVSARRLKSLSERLALLSLRLSWLRLGAFVVLFVGLVALIELRLWLPAVAELLLGSFGFGLLVRYHQGIRRQQRRVALALELKARHRARRQLDWEQIPAVPLEDPVPGHPFEIDLDITGPNSLYRLLHTCLSVEGGSRLKNWLLALQPDPEAIAHRQRLVAELRGQISLRDGLHLALAESAAEFRHAVEARRPWHSDEVLGLLAGLPARKLGRDLLGLGLLAAGNALLYAGWALKVLPLWYAQLGLCLYILLFWTRRGAVQQLFVEAHRLQYGLSRLQSLFALLERLAPSRGPALQELLVPFAGREKPSDLLRRLGRVVAAASLQGNPMLWVIFNLAVPWDFYFAWRLETLKPRLRTLLPAWLETIHELEALCALAHYAWLHPAAPYPRVEGSGLHAEGLGHPLLPAGKVRNDFSLAGPGQGFLITGSNMAGKSTFLKSLGLNLVLAQAGTVVDAAALQTGPVRLFTCIRVSDSVTDGLSYFYTEVRRLKALLDAIDADQPWPVFFLVDEIFKGTNNRERLIGSRSYIQALTGRAALGGISTHDLELVHLADQNALLHNYHFRETIADGRMSFDFRLRPGPCPTTNALRIMALEGLPVEGLNLEADQA